MALRLPTLPRIPNPDDPAYRGNPVAYNRALYSALIQAFGQLENAFRQNQTPLDQPYAVSSFTTNTALTGTSTLGDVANYVCSLVQSLQKKGIVKPV